MMLFTSLIYYINNEKKAMLLISLVSFDKPG